MRPYSLAFGSFLFFLTCNFLARGEHFTELPPARLPDEVDAFRDLPTASAPRGMLDWLPTARFPDDPTTPISADEIPDGPWGSGIGFPKGMKRYAPAKMTQRLADTSFGDGRGFVPTITPVPRTVTAKKYQVPGGLMNSHGWESTLYSLVPEKSISVWTGGIRVENGIPNGRGGFFTQVVQGRQREFSDGARFDDVLTYRGQVFEHRSWFREEGVWTPEVLYRDRAAAPPGYKAPRRRECRSCHAFAGGAGGDGKYADGMPPGGDNIFSFPMYGVE